MKITLAQLNPIVGDFSFNLHCLESAASKAAEEGSRLLVFSECVLCGYPPLDLLQHPDFLSRLAQAGNAVSAISKRYPGMYLVVGLPTQVNGALFNSACVYLDGEVVLTQNKQLLPQYDVFDEARYFTPGNESVVLSIDGHCFGFLVCEDAWSHAASPVKYAFHPIEALVQKGATAVIALMASPFEDTKMARRQAVFQDLARRYSVPIVGVNQVGATDELVFDGSSFVINSFGQLCYVGASFVEDVRTLDWELCLQQGPLAPHPSSISDIYQALVLGIRDYGRKTGFERVVLGLSGGIDSALCACLAVDALGAQNVLGVALPSMYSSEGSVADARQLALNLGISFRVIPISPIYETALDSLSDALSDAHSLAKENLQARLRGVMLMAISNEDNRLLLTTGNKSEMSVGYCTLYGDMNGGLAVLSDVYKTQVYELAHYINRSEVRIPESSIIKPPSAELRPNQTDQDSLPDYAILDRILKGYIELSFTPEQLIEQGNSSEIVTWVLRAIHRNEYKRRQAPPGIKISQKAFGIGRRYPLAYRYV